MDGYLFRVRVGDPGRCLLIREASSGSTWLPRLRQPGLPATVAHELGEAGLAQGPLLSQPEVRHLGAALLRARAKIVKLTLGPAGWQISTVDCGFL